MLQNYDIPNVFIIQANVKKFVRKNTLAYFATASKATNKCFMMLTQATIIEMLKFYSKFFDNTSLCRNICLEKHPSLFCLSIKDF